MFKQTFSWLIITLLFSCNSNHESSAFTEDTSEHETVYEVPSDTVYVEAEDETNEEWYIYERLPEWFVEAGIAHELIIEEKYRIDNRLNPLYLEEDFNGDGFYDLAIPIVDIGTDKVGFAIIHGNTKEVFIIGAGHLIEHAHSDDMGYIDIWRISREEEHPPGLDEDGEVNPVGPLKLFLPALEILKSEVGGGLIYWTGEGYAYFHQTC